MSTLRLHRVESDTGRPPKSNKDKLVNKVRVMTPSAVTPVSGIHNFSKLGMVVRCPTPASVIFEHLERSSSFKFVIPDENENIYRFRGEYNRNLARLVTFIKTIFEVK